MRLHDTVVDIAASRESVFAFLCDPTKIKRWQPDVVTTAIVAGDGRSRDRKSVV